jgi:hypothetical protein
MTSFHRVNDGDTFATLSFRLVERFSSHRFWRFGVVGLPGGQHLRHLKESGLEKRKEIKKSRVSRNSYKIRDKPSRTKMRPKSADNDIREIFKEKAC